VAARTFPWRTPLPRPGRSSGPPSRRVATLLDWSHASNS